MNKEIAKQLEKEAKSGVSWNQLNRDFGTNPDVTKRDIVAAWSKANPGIEPPITAHERPYPIPYESVAKTNKNIYYNIISKAKIIMVSCSLIGVLCILAGYDIWGEILVGLAFFTALIVWLLGLLATYIVEVVKEEKKGGRL